MATYSSTDVHIETTKTESTSATTTSNSVQVPTNSPVLNDVVKFIESSKDVPVSHIETVIKATSSQTVFGNEIITVEGVSSDSTKVQVVVNYNPSTKDIKLHNYEVLQTAQVTQEAVTEFKVDVLTGTKTTTTNDVTVIASSEITTALIKELQQTKSELVTSNIISSTTVEYPDKVKVITVFSEPTSTESVTQVTSIFDKLTTSVRVIDTTTTTLEEINTTTNEARQVFTSSEVVSASTTIPAIPATTTFLQSEFPIYVSQTPSTVIVEPLGKSDFVSYIYESATSKTQVVVLYNQTSGESTLLESNPVQLNIQPFFYEEKKNHKGESVVVSNNLTEVAQRVHKGEVLKNYLNSETTIDASNIKTVETVVGSGFNTYTLVVDSTEGLKQYEYLVNTVTEEVKQIENKTLPGINNVVLPQHKPAIQVNPQSETVLPLINTIISTASSGLTSTHSVVSVNKTELSNVQSYDIEYVNEANQLTKLVVTEAVGKKPIVVDERPILPKFVAKPPVVIAETIDAVTKTSQVTYSSNETFLVDVNAKQVLQYANKNIPEVQGYTLESVRKSVIGQIEQYDMLYKSTDKAPIQISIANDNNNKNMLLLENKRITEPEQRSVLDSAASQPQVVEISEVEKENIKVLSKLGLVKDVKEYKEVSLTNIGQNDQFVAATEAVKQSYSVLLKESVIIKVLEKKSL